jgi:antitoxin component YwqK of YwqJK toxin-antitoxin module
MNIRIYLVGCLLAVSAIAASQASTEINRTDPQGKRQGHWIKKYPNENIMYEGNFKDDHPVGEFRRYYDDKTPKSLLVFSQNGSKADATLYHPNGYISSKGTYINQKKEGKWQFYSQLVRDVLIAEEYYTGNLRNGQSITFYPDGKVAEKINYVNDLKQGEWTKYYPDGTLCLKSVYHNDKIDGKFEVWFENGRIQFSGQYKNDTRDGTWLVYDNKGSIKYKLKYIDGVTNDKQMDIDESDYLDSLEKNIGKIADPEKQE